MPTRLLAGLVDGHGVPVEVQHDRPVESAHGHAHAPEHEQQDGPAIVPGLTVGQKRPGDAA